MPDIIATSSQNVLPVWDSFEAVFFVFAGMSVGFVLGYLFPSIWRTIRRRFRSHRQFVVTDIPWKRSLDLDIKILDTQKNNDDLASYKLIEIFVIARDFTQRGEFRNAIKAYGEILTSEKATTLYIHRAMFELSQVYFSLGLFIRAFDTAYDLLKRKPRDGVILSFLLDVLNKHKDDHKLHKIFKVFKGSPNDQLRKYMSHVACNYADFKLTKNLEYSKAVNLAKLALSIYPESFNAKTLLWESLSIRTRQKKSLDIQSEWVAFAADFGAWMLLCKNSVLTPSPGFNYLSKLMENLLISDAKLNYFNSIKKEFWDNLKLDYKSKTEQKLLLSSMIYIGHYFYYNNKKELLILYISFINNLFINQIQFSEIISSFFVFSNEKKFVNNYLNPEVLKLGLQAHVCKQCRSIFEKFQWSCGLCHSFEPLERLFSPFTEYAFNEQNWHHHKDNRNRCAHSHLDS